MVQQRRGVGESGPLNDKEGEDMWKKLWRLDVLGATKHFVWKATNNILPTRVNLWQRKIVEDPLCPICKMEEEDGMHALWNCPAAMDVWGETSSPINKWPAGGKDFVQLWLELSCRLQKETLEVVVVIMKGIWYRMNNFVFQNRFTSPCRIVQIATTGLEEYHEVNQIKGVSKRPETVERQDFLEETKRVSV